MLGLINLEYNIAGRTKTAAEMFLVLQAITFSHSFLLRYLRVMAIMKNFLQGFSRLEAALIYLKKILFLLVFSLHNISIEIC
jgi:hypothetical protein